MTEKDFLRASAQKIEDALAEAESWGFHVVVDEDGDGGVTVWSGDRVIFAEAIRDKSGGWTTRSGSP